MKIYAQDLEEYAVVVLSCPVLSGPGYYRQAGRQAICMQLIVLQISILSYVAISEYPIVVFAGTFLLMI